jgi:hypothetical protein
MLYRYILQMNVMDHAGSFWITAFNETAEQIMGITANDLMRHRVGSAFFWTGLERAERSNRRITRTVYLMLIFKRQWGRLSRSR